MRKKVIIPPGTRYGKLTVIEELPDRTIRCKCDCGKETIVFKPNLTKGNTRSCGCMRGRKSTLIPVGTRVNHLVVLENLRGGLCRCKCDCGNETVAQKYYLLNGMAKSCGCMAGRKKIPIPAGIRFGKLTVIEELPDARIKCICDCGKTHICNKYQLRAGKVQSCGCSKGVKKTALPAAESTVSAENASV